eukprot:s2156_g9.t1
MPSRLQRRTKQPFHPRVARASAGLVLCRCLGQLGFPLGFNWLLQDEALPGIVRDVDVNLQLDMGEEEGAFQAAASATATSKVLPAAACGSPGDQRKHGSWRWDFCSRPSAALASSVPGGLNSLVQHSARIPGWGKAYLATGPGSQKSTRPSEKLGDRREPVLPARPMAALPEREPTATSPTQYAAAVKRHADARRWDAASYLLHQMWGNNFLASIQTTDAVLNAKKWEACLDLFEEIGQRGLVTDRSFSIVINACGKASKWQHGLDLFNSFEGGTGRGRVVVHNAAISCCERGQQWEQALVVLARLGLRKEADVVSYSAAMSACVRCEVWQYALALLGELGQQRLQTDLIIQNTAISACEKGDQWQKALALLLGLKSRSLKADLVSYSAAISSCAKGQWQIALYLLDDVFTQGLSVDIIIYSAAISACGSGEQWEMALSLFMGLAQQQLAANRVAYNAVISACENSGRWQLALFLLAELLQKNMPCELQDFNVAISACEKAWQWQEGLPWQHALSLLVDLQLRSFSPNEVTYSAAISSCEKGGEWEQALVLLADVFRMELQPNRITYSAAISACEKGRQWQFAVLIFGQLLASHLGADEIAYHAVISACEKGGRWQHAIFLLSELGSGTLEVDVIAQSTALRACEACEARVAQIQALLLDIQAASFQGLVGVGNGMPLALSDGKGHRMSQAS